MLVYAYAEAQLCTAQRTGGGYGVAWENDEDANGGMDHNHPPLLLGSTVSVDIHTSSPSISSAAQAAERAEAASDSAAGADHATVQTETERAQTESENACEAYDEARAAAGEEPP